MGWFGFGKSKRKKRKGRKSPSNTPLRYKITSSGKSRKFRTKDNALDAAKPKLRRGRKVTIEPVVKKTKRKKR